MNDENDPLIEPDKTESTTRTDAKADEDSESLSRDSHSKTLDSKDDPTSDEFKSLDNHRESEKLEAESVKDETDIFAFIHKVRVATTDVIIICIIILIAIILSHRVWFSNKVLEKIEVSKSLDEQGLSSVSVSERLADEIKNLQPDNTDFSKRRKLLEPGWEVVDVQVPGGNISIHAISDLLKEEFWSGDRRITGELNKDRDDKLRITIREEGSGETFTTGSYSIVDLDRLVNEAAKDAVRLIDPATLASYYFAREAASGDFKQTKEEIYYALKHDYIESGPRALNILGNMLSYSGEYEEAISKYMQSISLSPKYAEVYVNLGDALAATGGPRSPRFTAIQIQRFSPGPSPRLHLGVISIRRDSDE